MRKTREQVQADRAARRALSEVELWEVSLVTFPMLPDARVGAKAAEQPQITGGDALAGAFAAATEALRAL